MTIIPIFVLIASLFAYNYKKFEWTLLGLMFYTTQGFMFLELKSFIIKPLDFCLIILGFITLFEGINVKGYFSFKKDKMALLFCGILVYHVYELILTVSSRAETFDYAFKVERINLLFFAYFWLRNLDPAIIKKFFDLYLIVAIVDGVFFYLQTVGVNGYLIGRIDEATTVSEQTRYMNLPLLAGFYLCYAFVSNKNILTKMILIVFWGGMFILAQRRGAIISVGAALLVYVVWKRQFKYYVAAIIFTIIAAGVITPMFEYRDKESRSDKSTMEQIHAIFIQQDYRNIDVEGSSFLFRAALLSERIYYLIDHPEYMATGVGAIHEESPNCYQRFLFDYGTANSSAYYGYSLVMSGDVTWAPIILRYGIIGLALYITILILWLFKGFPRIRKYNNVYFGVCSLSVISSMAGSLNSQIFDHFPSFMTILFFISYLESYRREHPIKNNSRLIGLNTIKIANSL